MSRLTKNDVAWEAIFRDFPILKKVDSIGRYYITADTINVYREARLMAKFDSYHELPKIMKKNNLYIINTTITKIIKFHIIFPFNIFCDKLNYQYRNIYDNHC